jgi:hypothetical protein
MHAGRSAVPPVVGPSPPAGVAPVPDPLTPDPSIEAPLLSDTELLDLFQRPLYDIHRAWRAPLFRIVKRLSQAILDGSPLAEDKCTLAFLLLLGLVAECHFGKWLPVAALLAHLVSGIDRVTSDLDFGNMVLSQAQAVVPRIQAYRERSATRRDSPPVDHIMIASLQRQIERLLRERRLRLANKLIDKLNLSLQGGSITPDVALSLEEVRAQVTKLFPSAGSGDTFSDAQIQLA